MSALSQSHHVYTSKHNNYISAVIAHALYEYNYSKYACREGEEGSGQWPIYPSVRCRNFILYQHVVERHACARIRMKPLSFFEVIDVQSSTFRSHIIDHGHKCKLPPTAAFQPWLCRRIGHLPRPFLLPPFKLSRVSEAIEDSESGTMQIIEISVCLSCTQCCCKPLGKVYATYCTG